MNARYYIEKDNIYCNYYNKNIKMTTIFSNIDGKKIPFDKKCSDWGNCTNRNFCEYGRNRVEDNS